MVVGVTCSVIGAKQLIKLFPVGAAVATVKPNLSDKTGTMTGVGGNNTDSWPHERLVTLRWLRSNWRWCDWCISMSIQRRSVEAVGKLVPYLASGCRLTLLKWRCWNTPLSSTAGAEFDNWELYPKLPAVATVTVTDAAAPVIAMLLVLLAKGSTIVNFIRLLACVSANELKLLLQLQLKGRSFVASGEICGNCRPSSSGSSPLTMLRMLSKLCRLCIPLQQAKVIFMYFGVPGVNEKSISESGNSLVEESILKKDNLSVTRICKAERLLLLVLLPPPPVTPTSMPALVISSRVDAGTADYD